MNIPAMKLSAWSGIAFLVLIGIGFWALAGFIPPPSPHDTAAQISRQFHGNETGIRFGMIISMFASGLLGPFVAQITIQMRRIEGRHSILAFTQLALGAIFGLEFIYLIFFWQTAAFRPERSAAIIQSLDDMGWIPFVGLSSTNVLMPIVLGWCVLADKRAKPIFPRWFGYFNIWAGLMFTPGSFNVFFHTGPLAWNGLIAFYIPVAIFAIWCIVVSLQLVKAVEQQVADNELDPPQTAPMNGERHPVRDEQMATEIAALREDLARVAARV
jgi:hypothetical protein